MTFPIFECVLLGKLIIFYARRFIKDLIRSTVLAIRTLHYGTPMGFYLLSAFILLFPVYVGRYPSVENVLLLGTFFSSLIAILILFTLLSENYVTNPL